MFGLQSHPAAIAWAFVVCADDEAPEAAARKRAAVARRVNARRLSIVLLLRVLCDEPSAAGRLSPCDVRPEETMSFRRQCWTASHRQRCAHDSSSCRPAKHRGLAP